MTNNKNKDFHMVTSYINYVYKHSSVIQEDSAKDLIFNNGYTVDNFGSTPPKNDSDYDSPDYRIYYFTNIYKSYNYYNLLPNGISSAIRYKAGLSYPAIFSNHASFKDGFHREGIFIVEYIRVSHGSIQNYDEYYNTLINSKYMDLDQDQVESFRTILMESRNTTTKRGVNSFSDFYLRLITYVPSSNFDYNMPVYVSTTDSYLIKGAVNEHMIHPRNKNYDELEANITLVNEKKSKNIVEIDIIDNSTSDPYYITVGNKAIPVLPRSSLSTNETATITYKNNGVIVSENNHTLDGAENIGIYRTEKEAVSNGDKRLELDNKKLSYEYDKLATDNAMLKLKLAHEVSMVRLKTYNIELDMKYSKYKNKIELALLQLKFHYTRYNELVSVRNKYIDSTININTAILKHKHTEELHKKKMSEKNTISGLLADADKAVNIISKIIK